MNGVIGKFEEYEWQSPLAGVRFKIHTSEDKQLRVVEFTPEFVEREWCHKGHWGFVIEGDLEITYGERVVVYRANDGIIIPPGERHAHKARALTPVVRLFLVEEAS